MVKLHKEDIKTKEVLGLEGIHLFHFFASSCSQKTRIFLNLKGIHWESHPVDLVKQENFSPWFLGINPRGLVPVLVHDGNVHIESNDILVYLEDSFPSPCLIPNAMRNEIVGGLREEDDLHLDIRNITMRFVLPGFLARKKPASLESYESNNGTVRGESDSHKQVELEYWQSFAEHGVTDHQIQLSAKKLRHVFDGFEQRLCNADYLAGADVSLLDIAWFIYVYRLDVAGYPFKRLHPRVDRWYRRLLEREEFSREVATPLPLRLVTGALHAVHRLNGRSFENVANL